MQEKTFFGFKTGPKGLFNIANLFTVIRLPMSVYAMVLYSGGQEFIAVVVFILAAITDLLDGRLARATGCVSQLGEILDPTTDKIGMAMIGIWSMFIVGNAWLLVLIILAMEALTAGQSLFALFKGVQIETHEVGKWAITWRAVAVLLFLIASNGDNIGWNTMFGLGLVAFAAGIIMGYQAFLIYRKQLALALA